MPSISQFVARCELLGIDHIEVVPTVDYNENGITSVAELIKHSQISQSKFNEFKDELEETDIVFFLPDGSPGGGNVVIKAKSLDSILSTMTKEEAKTYLNNLKAQGITLDPNSDGSVTVPVSNDLFIQNAIYYTERGGGQDFSYETHTLDLPLVGGIRVFNKEVKDEIVAKGLLCLNIMDLKSIDDMEDGKYKDDSLYGMLEKKVKVLMGERESLSEVKIPWLYNCIGTGKIIEPNSSSLNRKILSSQNFSVQSNATVEGLYIKNTKVSSNNYQYDFYVGGRSSGNDVNTPTRLLTPETLLLYVKMKKASSSNFSGDTTLWDIRDGEIQCDVWGGYTYPKGYNKNLNLVDRKSDGDTIYTEKPYIFGMIPLIYSLNLNNKVAQSYIFVVAFREDGSIITPKIPYANTETLGQVEYSNSDTVIICPDVLPSTSIFYKPVEINGATYSQSMKGNVCLDVNIPMTDEEIAYATSQDYIIAPTDWIPEGYIDE